MIFTVCCGSTQNSQYDELSKHTNEKQSDKLKRETESIPVDSNLSIHFIDVGQGDATLIICDGQVMMIDGGPANKSDLIYTYLKQNNINFIDYMIATQEDFDRF